MSTRLQKFNCLADISYGATVVIKALVANFKPAKANAAASVFEGVEGSNEWIMRHTGFSSSTVKRHIKALVEAGVITKSRNNSSTINIFTIYIDKLEELGKEGRVLYKKKVEAARIKKNEDAKALRRRKAELLKIAIEQQSKNARQQSTLKFSGTAIAAYLKTVKY